MALTYWINVHEIEKIKNVQVQFFIEKSRFTSFEALLLFRCIQVKSSSQRIKEIQTFIKTAICVYYV